MSKTKHIFNRDSDDEMDVDDDTSSKQKKLVINTENTKKIAVEEPLQIGSSSNKESSKEISDRSKNGEGPRRYGSSRGNMKSFNVNEGDLWALGAKYPTVPILGDILATAGTGKNPIPKNFTKRKEGTKAVNKPELLARVLFFKKSRNLLLDWLKEYNEKDDIGVGEDSKLSDFYIQFNEEGIEWPGDQEETEEFLISSGIPHHTDLSARLSQEQIVPEKKESNLKQSTLKHLKEAVAEDNNPSEISEKREKYISELLALYSEFTVKSLKKEIERIKKAIEDN